MSKQDEIQEAAEADLADQVIGAIKTAKEHGVEDETIESILKTAFAAYQMKRMVNQSSADVGIDHTTVEVDTDE